jgi:hypothetical protein
MTTLGDYALMSSPHNKNRYVDDINGFKLWRNIFGFLCRQFHLEAGGGIYPQK